MRWLFGLFLKSGLIDAPFLKKVHTIEHWVLACGNSSYHLESEFVPFTVCKLVGWSFFIVYPSLFRAWTTEKANSASFALMCHQDRLAIQRQ